MQPNKLDEYHVFLASPGDVEEERKEVRKFFDSFNISTAARWGVRFTVVDWENYSTIGVGRPQELITEQTLDKFRDSLALVVGIMAQKFGSPTGTHESGTEEEFEWSLKLNLESSYPEIKWFFKNVKKFEAPPDVSQIELALAQWKKVGDFKQKLKSNDPPIFYQSWSDSSDFREKLRDDLNLWLNCTERPWFAGLDKNVDECPGSEDYSLPLSYYASLEQTYRSLDIRGIDNDKAVDIPLSDVYVRLRVMRDEDVETEESDQEFGELNIHDALSRFKRLVIVGDPGSGKSTFLKYIALILAQSRIANDSSIAVAKLNLTESLPIPVFISLWDLSDYLKTNSASPSLAIIEFIVAKLRDFKIKLANSDVENLLEHGNCCLLFDGLDEVPTEQGRGLISRLLETFVSQYKNCRYVVTSRVRGYTGDSILKNEFVRCDIQDFDKEDRAEFLRNWFSALFRVGKEEVTQEGTKSNREFIELYSSIEAKDRIRALAVNPLLMTVIAIVHWNRKRLPDQRVDLYDECVDVLLGQRKIAERVEGSNRFELLNEMAEEEIQYDRTWTRKRFGEIALLILQSGAEDEATRESVINLLIPRFLDRIAENRERAEHQAEAFLDNQELRSGLLVSRKSRSCRFVHLTFQEYLAAWNLSNQSWEEIMLSIKTHLRNPQWFETLQLLGGELAKSSDEKLDNYVSYLLSHIGKKIADQAPMIALCANILNDVKGVADIKYTTQEAYTDALKNTLNAFKPDSGIPPKTQIEVLSALSALGASVKNHLIQATKSSYFQVRSEALSLLITHLSDDDLFAMSHIFKDRSQEPIYVYTKALFERDEARALKIIKEFGVFNFRQIKALLFVFEHYLPRFEDPEIFRIIKTIVREYGVGISIYFAKIISVLKAKELLHEDIRRMLIQLIDENSELSEELDALANGYSEDEITWKYLSSKFETHRWAASVISREPGKFEGSDEVLEKMARNRQATEWQRRSSLKILVYRRIRFYDFRAREILSMNDWYYIDPLFPISRNWMLSKASLLGVYGEEMAEMFRNLAKKLPIELEF